MRIQELLEGTQFKSNDWVNRDGHKTELNYDLAEDLVFFMNNDDDIYRRHVYPSIAKCLENFKAKKSSPNVFLNAVKESYKSYIRKYPVRELPNEIEEKVCKEACEKMHEEICQHIKDGKYKD